MRNEMAAIGVATATARHQVEPLWRRLDTAARERGLKAHDVALRATLAALDDADMASTVVYAATWGCR